jgi:hypothetical protein
MFKVDCVKIITVREKFFSIEEDLNLFELDFFDFKFWDYLRYGVYKDLLNFSSISAKNVNISSRYLDRLLLLKHSFFSIVNPRCLNPHDVLFFGHPQRRLLEDNLWWDIYSDPLVDVISNQFKTLLIEKPVNSKHFAPSKTKNIHYLDHAYLCSSIARRFSVKNFHEKNKFLDNVENEFFVQFGFKLNIYKRIRDAYIRRKVLMQYFDYLINKVKPKIVFVVVGYLNKEFIESCKKNFVPVIELQHGTAVNSGHVGYSYPHNVKLNTFPDYLLTFGDYWLSRCSYPVDKSKVVSVGFPYLELQKNKYKKFEKRRQIVFISQPMVGKYLVKMALHLLNSANFQYDIVYKLHPCEYSDWSNLYPELRDSNLKVVKNEIPLYQLLSESQFVVAHTSTVVYEALEFDCSVLLYNFTGIESMIDLIEKKVLYIFDNVEELLHIIKKNESVSNNYSVSFFKKNSICNILNLINQINFCK